MESKLLTSNDRRLWKELSDTNNDKSTVGISSTDQNLYCIKHLIPKDNENGIRYPKCNDVLSGRGGLINKHSGNISFRRLIERNKSIYHTCQKEFKPLLAKSIVLALYQSSPPGRFLVKDEASGLWYNIGERKAIAKTRQALREGAPEVRMMSHRDIAAKQPVVCTQLQIRDKNENEVNHSERNTTFHHGKSSGYQIHESSILCPPDSEEDQDIYLSRFVLIENDEIDNIDILNSFNDDDFDENLLMVTEEQKY